MSAVCRKCLSLSPAVVLMAAVNVGTLSAYRLRSIFKGSSSHGNRSPCFSEEPLFSNFLGLLMVIGQFI